jgi:hypothetical protein
VLLSVTAGWGIAVRDWLAVDAVGHAAQTWVE